MKKKVLFLGNCYYVVFRFRKEIIESLVDSGYDVWTAFPNGSHGEKERGEETSKIMGCHFIELSMTRRSANPFEEVKLITQIWRIYKRIKPDIVLTYTVKPNIYGGLMAKIMGVPYIINVTGLGSAFNKKGFFAFFLRYMYLSSMKSASRVFFQNASDLDYFKKFKYDEKNVQMIPGSGVNLNEYHVLPYPNDEKVRFLYIARIMKEKGIEEYLTAAKEYKNDLTVEFHICGDCEEDYSSEINELNQNGTVVYHGQVSNVKDYEKMCSCVILPSYYHEGISNSLLEAAACGRPIITTDHPGCRETVDDGITGYIIKPRDSSDLIDKISRFLSLSYETKKNMGLAGRKKVEKEFDRQFVVDAYLKNILSIGK